MEPLTDNHRRAYRIFAHSVISGASSDYVSLQQALRTLQEWALEHLPHKTFTRKGDTHTPALTSLLQERKRAIRLENWAELPLLTKQIRRQRKADHNYAILDTISNELDIRDQWMGLRRLRTGYAPMPFSRKTPAGVHVPMLSIAQQAAAHLASHQWKA
eukprot:3904563-Prorocentrum_lima.AAC.1